MIMRVDLMVRGICVGVGLAVMTASTASAYVTSKERAILRGQIPSLNRPIVKSSVRPEIEQVTRFRTPEAYVEPKINLQESITPAIMNKGIVGGHSNHSHKAKKSAKHSKKHAKK